MNPYEVLEVAPGASSEEIKTAYHRLAKVWHPDRYSGAEKAQAEIRFRQLAEAFNMLKDPIRRGEYVAAAASVPHAKEETSPSVPSARTPDDWYRDALQAFEAREMDRALGLVQYALRLDAARIEFHILYVRVLEAMGGDLRTQIRALERVHGLAPRDPDVIIRLAELYAQVGMEARSKRMWDLAKNVAPTHQAVRGRKRAMASPKDAKGATPSPGEGSLFDQLKALIGRFTGKGE